jgi:hypothetical protein
MFDNCIERHQIFTVDEANAMLPLVRAITSDLVGLARDVCARAECLSTVLAGRSSFDPGDPYAEELLQVAERLEADHARLREFADELTDLGVKLRSAVEGLVDFPAVLDGRRVYLCWQLGEPEILFWHDTYAGYAERQPLCINVSSGDAPLAVGLPY